jgi:hypothetical protein
MTLPAVVLMTRCHQNNTRFQIPSQQNPVLSVLCRTTLSQQPATRAYHITLEQLYPVLYKNIHKLQTCSKITGALKLSNRPPTGA